MLIIIPVLTPILVRTGKLLIPKLPTWLLPILAPAIGEGVNALSGLAGGPTVSPMLALALGAAGTGLREIQDQVRSKMKSTTSTTTALLVIPLMLAVSGCHTTQIDPNTGQPVKVFDPVKTANVKAASEAFVTTVARRIAAKPKNEIYIRTVGAVFCTASTTGHLDPLVIESMLEQALADKLQDVDPLVIDAKNFLLALYRINYGNRFNAELSPEKWPKNVADVICNSVDTALKDLGKPGVK